jgi:hypothetical protein
MHLKQKKLSGLGVPQPTLEQQHQMPLDPTSINNSFRRLEDQSQDSNFSSAIKYMNPNSQLMMQEFLNSQNLQHQKKPGQKLPPNPVEFQQMMGNFYQQNP